MTAREPDPRPLRRRASAVAVLLLYVASLWSARRLPVRVVPGTEGSERTYRIVSVSPSESRLIVMDAEEMGDLGAIWAVDLATARRTDLKMASLPPGAATTSRRAEVHPETDQSTFVLWLGERFAMFLAPQGPCLVIDGDRMSAVPSRLDLFGPAPRPEEYQPQNKEEEGYTLDLRYPGAQIWKRAVGRGVVFHDADAPRRHVADSVMAALAPKVRYTYDRKVRAIVAQRDGGPRRVVLRLLAEVSGEGTPGAISPSPDGRYLAFVISRHRGFGVSNKLLLADLATGRRRQVAGLYAAEWAPWSRDSRRVYFANADGGLPMQVRVVDVDRLFGRR